MSSEHAAIGRFLQREQLPEDYRQAIASWYRPLAGDIARMQQQLGQALVLGIQGAQGTGKSTLAGLLAVLLESEHSLRVVPLSLDDFYLSHAARRQLARDVHPLLATRGVPGTHDVALALDTLQALRQACAGTVVALPGFDKASDDCIPSQQWRQVAGPVHVVILEGWCLGSPPQADAALVEPINELERERDVDGRWRRFVNDQLAGPYRQWFAQLDYLAVLQAPSFDCVYRWRGLQEQKLATRSTGNKIMDAGQLKRFIAHYERLTRHCLRCLPGLAQRVFLLDEDHRVVTVAGASHEQRGLNRC